MIGLYARSGGLLLHRYQRQLEEQADMTGWDTLTQVWTGFKSQPTVRAFDAFIDDGGIADRGIAGRVFTPEASYFSVRLVEMFLAESRKYFVEFLPLGVCVAEFRRGAVRQRVPLVLSNDLIESMLSGKKSGFVQFKDMYVVRRTPVNAENLSLFVGLFRIPYSDIAKQVIQLASDVTEELGGGALAAGAKIVDKVYDRVAGLFRLKDVEPRFGFLHGNALDRSGYLIVAGSTPAKLTARSLRVIGSQLHVCTEIDTQPAEGFDYCLIAIEHRESLFDSASDPSINELTVLPFDAKWKEVVRLLAAKNKPEAEQAMLGVNADVVASADLTEQDRLTAIAAYESAYLKYLRALIPQEHGAHRDTRGAAPVALRNEADIQGNSGRPEVGGALNAIASQLQNSDAEIPPDPHKPEMTFIAEAQHFRRELQAQGISARTSSGSRLAEAISLAANRSA